MYKKDFLLDHHYNGDVGNTVDKAQTGPPGQLRPFQL